MAGTLIGNGIWKGGATPLTPPRTRSLHGNSLRKRFASRVRTNGSTPSACRGQVLPAWGQRSLPLRSLDLRRPCMTPDERAIRDLIQNWLDLSSAGDMSKVLNLMTDDVVFMVPGQEPFGKEAFASRSGALKNAQLEAKSEIVEVRVVGDWAW